MVQHRDRYTQVGPEKFGDAELIALVLGGGTPRKSALEVGARVLSQFGSLPAVATADPMALAEVSGIGLNRAVRLHAALQLGRRSTRTIARDAPILTPDDAAAALVPGLEGLDYEELHALYLDRRNRPLALRTLTRGSDRYTIVDPRQVFRPAVQIGAASVVLAHNHPSGDPTPSEQDVQVTRRVAQAGEVMEIRLLDHIIVGNRCWTSLADSGDLASPDWL